MKKIYTMFILSLIALNAASLDVDGLKHQLYFECPTDYVLDYDLMCVHGNTANVVKPIKVQSTVIKGHGESVLCV